MAIKTIATCNDVEFLRQTNKIRHAVEKWLTATDIANIRNRLPKLKEVPEGADEKTRQRIESENSEITREQVKANMNAILDAALEEYPEQTAEIIRLCCFAEGESHKITYYLGAFGQMLGDEDVISFFQSLPRWVQMLGLEL